MTDVPAAIPVTKPEAFTVATPGIELVQVPPLVVLLHVAVVPIHSDGVPVIVWAVSADIVTVREAVFVHAPVVTE